MTTPTSVDRWQGRPVLSACLRVAVFAGPIVLSVLTSSLVGRSLPRADGALALAVRWAITLAAAMAVLVTSDRLARRLLPLAVLLKLSLVFPKEAPSRVDVARSAANLAELEERVRIARTTGFEDGPSASAEMILSLVAAVEAHDRSTRGHSERVRVYTDLIADQLKLYQEDRDRLRWAALLHDVGKLEVPKSVLNKAGPLEAGELEIVRRHPEEGARLTHPLHEWLGEWALAITEHHERFDGRGYPRALTGTEISLGGRIVSVADSYETMTAARPYHRPKSPAQAREELVRCAGTQFDPAIVRAFVGVSVRNLRRSNGSLSWLAQTPVFRSLGKVAGRVASSALVAAGALTISVAQAPHARAGELCPPAPVERSVASSSISG